MVSLPPCRALLITVALCCGVNAAAQALRVGVHDNPPFVAPTSSNTAEGLLFDVFAEVAAAQEREIQVVVGTVESLLDALHRGDLDVVIGISSTEFRAGAFDFSAPAVETPTEVLVHPGATANNLSDLAGKRIAVAETDGHAELVAAQMGAYGVEAQINVLPTYAAVAAAMQAGEADAGVLTQRARTELGGLQPLVRSSIALSPVGVRVAFRKDSNRVLLHALDDRLEEEKSDESSALNRAMMRWMGDTLQGYAWRMLRRILFVGALVIAALIVVAVLLRLQIQRRTRELRVANEQLRAEMAKRQQAQRSLEDSDRYHRALIENSLEIILKFDEHFIIHYVSPSIETVLGYTPGEVIGTPVWNWIHPDDVTIVQEVHETGMQNPGVPNWSEFRVKHKNGQWRDLESIGNNLLHHPVVAGIIANCRDITERKAAEYRMRRQARLDGFARDVGTALTQSETLNDSLTQFAAAAVRHLDLESACVWTLNPRENRLELSASAGDVSETCRNEPIPLGLPPIGLVAQEQKPFITNSAQTDPMLREAGAAIGDTATAFAAYPLLIEKTVVGAVAFVSRTPFDDTALETLAVATRSMAMAIRRRQAETALRDSEAMVRAIFETAVEGIVVSDAQGTIITVNHATERLFGYSAAELIGQNVRKLMPPPYADEHDNYIARYRMSGERRIMGTGREVRGLHRDGSIIDIAVSVSEIVVDGRTLFTGIIHDITQRKKAEAALKESEERFRVLVENAPEAIIVIDHETGRFEDVNENAVRLFGVDRETLLHMNPSALSPDVQPDGTPSVVKFVDKMELAMRGGTPVFEWTHRNAAGEEIECEVRLLRLPSADRQLLRGSITDITERKRAEKVLENYRVTLEEEVTARTEELAEKNHALEETLRQLRETQDQLVINQKMASLGALTAGIAHEIKNPLNFVNNFAEITAELTAELEEILGKHWNALGEDVQRDVESLLADIRTNTGKIGEHGRRADSIVRGMLLHSRGKPGERQEVTINELVDEYVKLAYHGMRAQNAMFNITIDTRYDPAAGTIIGVPQDLSRVFLNIINNACYAAHDRKTREDGEFSPMLTVTTRDCGDTVEIRIRDNGSGIPKDVAARVFEPFFTTKPAGKGTGLGLSISYDIVVQEHHGELLVESEPDEFTEFTIVLPRKPGERRRLERTAHAEGNGG